MSKWPACQIRQTEAGPVTVLAYAGVRKPSRGKTVFVCGYCENPGGGYRVEVGVPVKEIPNLIRVLQGLPPE
jgi:hypothetical protein